jgi:hypothetical protein
MASSGVRRCQGCILAEQVVRLAMASRSHFSGGAHSPWLGNAATMAGPGDRAHDASLAGTFALVTLLAHRSVSYDQIPIHKATWCVSDPSAAF